MKKSAVDNFTIVIDTREQKPYKFSNSITQGLPYGDYTLKFWNRVYIDEICLERKSAVSEIYSATGSNRDRWERELEKLSQVRIKAVLCEFDFLDLVNKAPDGKLLASCVYGSIPSWEVRFGVPFLFLGNRNNARAYLYKLFESFVKHEIIEKAESV